LDALQLKLDKLDAILNQVQPKKKKSASRWRRRRRRLNPNQTLNPKP
jgi:hypothetical protein